MPASHVEGDQGKNSFYTVAGIVHIVSAIDSLQQDDIGRVVIQSTLDVSSDPVPHPGLLVDWDCSSVWGGPQQTGHRKENLGLADCPCYFYLTHLIHSESGKMQ